jgi:DinB family protein
MPRMKRPEKTEYAASYGRYVDLVTETDIVSALEKQAGATAKILGAIDEKRSAMRYAPDKWSIKQLVGHVGDSERVFTYRALAFARDDKNALPGFEQDEWMRTSDFDRWSFADLRENLAVVRRASVLLFRNLPQEAWDRRGIASDNPMTVRAAAFTILGHERHHLNVLREKYGVM